MSESIAESGRLVYKILTRDKIQEAMEIQTQTMKQECLAVGLGMQEEPGAPEEMHLLFREIVRDGATIIAVDKETDEMAAVAFNKIHASLSFVFYFFILSIPTNGTVHRHFSRYGSLFVEGSTEGWPEGPAGDLHREELQASLVSRTGQDSRWREYFRLLAESLRLNLTRRSDSCERSERHVQRGRARNWQWS